jgi:hypothetical protein
VRCTVTVTLAVLTFWACAQPAVARVDSRPQWPRHIGRDYEMFTPAGNRAVRHVVWIAARRLRAGASRRRVMAAVSRAYLAVELKYDEATDTAVCERFADELDRWLTAAGYERIDAFDEFAF